MSTFRDRSKRRRAAKRERVDAMWLSQHGRCHYCNWPMLRPAEPGSQRKARPLDATEDHKTPASRGGSDDDANLVLACYRCNQAKDNMTEREFRSVFRRWLDQRRLDAAWQAIAAPKPKNLTENLTTT